MRANDTKGQEMTTGKVRTCRRCKGTGMTGHVVVHNGAPGTCYACDGYGKTRHFSMSERVELYLARCDRHLAEIEADAADTKTADENRHARRNARRAKQGKPALEKADSREIERLRDLWREVRARRAAAMETGKVTAMQSPASEPAYLMAKRAG